MQMVDELHSKLTPDLVSRYNKHGWHRVAEDELRKAFHAQWRDPAAFEEYMLGCALACLAAVERARK